MSGEAIAGDPGPVGYYGKIPAKGDFITRDLPRSFVDPWDRWLQNAIAHSQQQLGDGWLDAYLTSPVWRFALSPGVCGNDVWAGVLIPSIDRVGRYFPFTIAHRLDWYANPVELLHDGQGWYEQAEALALSCLEDEFDFDAFNDSVQAMQAIAVAVTGDINEDQTLAGGDLSAWHMPLPSLDLLPGAYASLAAKSLTELYFAFSCWWSAGSELVQPSLLLCQGLPPGSGYTSLLVGSWEQTGWQANEALAVESDERQKDDDDDITQPMAKR